MSALEKVENNHPHCFIFFFKLLQTKKNKEKKIQYNYTINENHKVILLAMGVV